MGNDLRRKSAQELIDEVESTVVGLVAIFFGVMAVMASSAFAIEGYPKITEFSALGLGLFLIALGIWKSLRSLK